VAVSDSAVVAVQFIYFGYVARTSTVSARAQMNKEADWEQPYQLVLFSRIFDDASSTSTTMREV
jgi:hypothetical protein